MRELCALCIVIGLSAGCGDDLGVGSSGDVVDSTADRDVLSESPSRDGLMAAPPVRLSDTYDPAMERYVVGDCQQEAVYAFEPDDDEVELEAVVDQWPWDGPRICPRRLAMGPGDTGLFAVVEREFIDPDWDGAPCYSLDLVSLDLDSGTATQKHNYTQLCCDDCGDSQTFDSQLFDPVSDRVLHLADDCDPNFCYTSDVVGIEPDTGTWSMIARLFELDCSMWGTEEECFENVTEVLGRHMVFDPTAPDAVIVFMTDWSLISADLATGAQAPIATVQRNYGAQKLFRILGMAVDATNQRLFLLSRLGPPIRFGVVAIDLDTGAQELLYDGAPNPQGAQPGCTPRSMAYDSDEDRVLLYEPCLTGGGVSAVDAQTGAYAKLPLD